MSCSYSEGLNAETLKSTRPKNENTKKTQKSQTPPQSWDLPCHQELQFLLPRHCLLKHQLGYQSPIPQQFSLALAAHRNATERPQSTPQHAAPQSPRAGAPQDILLGIGATQRGSGGLCGFPSRTPLCSMKVPSIPLTNSADPPPRSTEPVASPGILQSKQHRALSSTGHHAAHSSGQCEEPVYEHSNPACAAQSQGPGQEDQRALEKPEFDRGKE